MIYFVLFVFLSCIGFLSGWVLSEGYTCERCLIGKNKTSYRLENYFRMIYSTEVELQLYVICVYLFVNILKRRGARQWL